MLDTTVFSEVDTKQLKKNLSFFLNYIGEKNHLCFVLKANAYGHGLLDIAQIAVSEGVNYLAVASIEEALILRKAKISVPIFLMVPALREQLSFLFEHNITIFLSNLHTIEEIQVLSQKFQKPLSVHLKIDTGMNRLGFRIQEAHAIFDRLMDMEAISLEGFCTHFASADKDLFFTDLQEKEFSKFATEIHLRYPDHEFLVHAANSAATYLNTRMHFNMVRVGIGIYGYAQDIVGVRPIMSLRSKIIDIKELEKGDAIFYGHLWKAEKATKIALIPAGYSHGLFCSLSNKGSVKIADKYYPIVGSVCMNIVAIDIGDDTFPIETEVLFFGDDEILNAATIANLVDTIPYEILTRVNAPIRYR